MKKMLSNIGAVLFAFACCVLLNCGLIWLGVLGFAVSMVLIIFFVAGYLGLSYSSTPIWQRGVLLAAVALLYTYTIWYPEIWIAGLSGAVIIACLLKQKDYVLTEYTSTLILYFVTWDVAFYIIGDPVLEWVDAVLAVTALVCSGIWIYHAKIS